MSEAAAHTLRVEVGAFYTNGTTLAQVTRVYPLGHVQMRDCVSGSPLGVGISEFRRTWWRC
jgi:hypothetical protein